MHGWQEVTVAGLKMDLTGIAGCELVPGHLDGAGSSLGQEFKQESVTRRLTTQRSIDACTIIVG